MNGESNTPRVIDFFSNQKNVKKAVAPAKKKTTKATPINQDIIEINSKILTLLEDEFKNLPKLLSKLDRLRWIIKNSTDKVEKKIANKKLTDLEIQVNLIESGFRHAEYIHKTESIIETYTKILEEPVKIDFMGTKQTGQEEHKQDILFEFLNIARYYIDLPAYSGRTKNTTCEDCKVELQKEDDYLYVCPQCGFLVKHLASIASYQENNRINVAQRYVYDKRTHFGDAIKKFQAKQNTTIPQKVYDDIEMRMNNHEISILRLNKNHIFEFLRLNGHSEHYEDVTLIFCHIIRNSIKQYVDISRIFLTNIRERLQKNGLLADRITIKQLTEFLEMNGYSSYCKDVEYIHCYIKAEPPDISHLESDLFRLFDEIDPVYETVKPADRVNFLNGQFTLFKLLQKLQFPCREEDFYILKTRDKLIEQDKIWKKICNELNWTYIATV